MKKEELVKVINALTDVVRQHQQKHPEACIFCEEPSQDSGVHFHTEDCDWYWLVPAIEEAQGDA